MIQLGYNNLISSCNGAIEVTIECTNWKNPIYPDTWDGFSITTYDSENNIINGLQNPGELDALAFTPISIPSTNFDKQFDI